jgi:hypothetical protein
MVSSEPRMNGDNLALTIHMANCLYGIYRNTILPVSTAQYRHPARSLTTPVTDNSALLCIGIFNILVENVVRSCSTQIYR